mmetsp:Transcript_5952/g.10076  ORF Transcript_5952/g.10076 Transcript_5952/m.10076 type:complete len:111 (+) Transcript_5952:370-702(+)
MAPPRPTGLASVLRSEPDGTSPGIITLLVTTWVIDAACTSSTADQRPARSDAAHERTCAALTACQNHVGRRTPPDILVIVARERSLGAAALLAADKFVAVLPEELTDLVH